MLAAQAIVSIRAGSGMVAGAAERPGELERARRLERGLVRVRWFAVALGAYLVSQTGAGPLPRPGHGVVVAAYTLMAVLAAGNLALMLAVPRIGSLPALRALGVGVFLFDEAVIFALAWIYSYDPRGTAWVVLYILPLEGALRYRLEGAAVSVGMVLVNEVAREAYLAARFSRPTISGGAFIDRYPFLVSNVAFRVGIAGIIALVAGFMARSLAREAEKAEEQAGRFREAARREASARSELAAFNSAVLTGVAAADLDTSLRLMAGAIGRDLDYQAFSILMSEGGELVVKGMHGMPFYESRIPLGAGVTGAVAATGKALVVPDVAAFPGYIVADPRMRSEMAAPMRIGDELIGVLDVESSEPDAFDRAALDVLCRLADQIALVAHNNRLLSQQADTVRRLQELDQMKSDFVAITSHELRTPITAIRGFVRTLIRNRDRLSEQQVDSFMQIVDRQSGRLARLVEDLLFISKIEAGTIRLSMSEVDVGAFLREVVEGQAPEVRGRVRLEVRPGDARVVVDPQRLDQVIRNLVDNALKFSPPDAEVLVKAELKEGSFRVSVIDGGPGIAPGDLPRIFDRFHQAGKALTREADGAGLGLYITKRLVEAMQGTISVASGPGHGSTFVVTVPALARARPAERREMAQKPAEHAS